MNPENRPVRPGARGEAVVPRLFREYGEYLYGCHHLPQGQQTAEKAVVICNAIGHEYERCHRSMRQMARQLARRGCHALRFDYFGTGDSAGEYTDASLAQWRADINDAIEECKRQAGLGSVSLAGVRVGATLAAQAVVDRDDIESLVMYAPIHDGGDLLADWERQERSFRRKHGHGKGGSPSGEVLGYPVSDAFRAELKGGMGLPGSLRGPGDVLVILESGQARLARILAEKMQPDLARSEIELEKDIAIWQREPDAAIVPGKLIGRIVNWLRESGA